MISVTAIAQNMPGLEFVEQYDLPETSIRAIEVVDDNTLWFAGSGGKYGRIINGEMQLDSIEHKGNSPHFRSIAYNGQFIFLLSIEDPALLFKIDPEQSLGNYELVYQESNPKVFYDSMIFFDPQNGIAMGDPTENCLSILRTKDAGLNWTKNSCKTLPEIAEGEAAFAASNTNIAAKGKTAWIATGGVKARVFKSTDLGQNWTVIDTPIVQGGKMTGIFSIDFYDEKQGIIMGGNWEDKADGEASKAVTDDGGKTWRLIAENQLPGYISCVQYVPKGKGKKICAVSTEGIYYSDNSGSHWEKIENEGYYTLRFLHKGTAWVAGHEKISKIKID